MAPRMFRPDQEEILAGLARGDRIVGPDSVRGRKWRWCDGRRVNANSINSLMARGVLAERRCDIAEREAALTEHEGKTS